MKISLADENGEEIPVVEGLVETLKKELEEVTNVAETKTRESIALVDERECLARELENGEIDNRKLRGRVKTEHTSKKVIQRMLEAINAQSPFCRPPNFYELLILPQGATTSTIQKHFKTLAMLCHPDKVGREDMFKIILQAKKNMEDEEARNIYDKYEIEKAQGYMNSKMDFWNSCCVSEWNTHIFYEIGGIVNHNVSHAHKLHFKRIIRNFHKQIGEQKEMVTNTKPDFNNIEKAS